MTAILTLALGIGATTALFTVVNAVLLEPLPFPDSNKLIQGIHAGPAIVGAMGYGGVMNVTAIGDTVNVASRLEAAAKEFNAAIVVSDAVVALSGLDLSGYEAREIEIRGSKRPLHVRVVPQGVMLEAGFADAPAAQSAA